MVAEEGVEEGVIKVTEIGVIGTKAGVVDEMAVKEDTVVGGIMTVEDLDVTVSEPKPTEKPGTSHGISQNILNMFLEQTNSFYRYFFCSSGVYAVAS